MNELVDIWMVSITNWSSILKYTTYHMVFLSSCVRYEGIRFHSFGVSM